MRSTWRWPLALAVLVFVGVAALTRGDSVTKTKTTDPFASIRPPAGTKIGLIVSGTGPGNDVFPWSAGALVAQYTVNGRKAGTTPVEVVTADDGSDPAKAVEAVQKLVRQGVAGIVYASLGDQMLPAVKAAADANVPVLVPYSSDERLLNNGATTFLTGPGDSQVAAELAAYAQKRSFAKVGLLYENTASGQLAQGLLSQAGLDVVKAVPIDAGAGALTGAVTEATGGDADAVVVWGTADEAVRVSVGAVEGKVNPQYLLASRAASPAFGKGQAQMLAPAVTDGVVSAGTWAGPWTPTAAVDRFYDDRLGAGEVSTAADVSGADLRSFDAALALIEAADDAGSTKPADVLASLRTLKPMLAGPPLSFATQHALADEDVALLTYTTLDDGSGRYPDPKANGGHWVAVDGTYTLPVPMRGLDKSFGG